MAARAGVQAQVSIHTFLGVEALGPFTASLGQACLLSHMDAASREHHVISPSAWLFHSLTLESAALSALSGGLVLARPQSQDKAAFRMVRASTKAAATQDQPQERGCTPSGAAEPL